MYGHLSDCNVTRLSHGICFQLPRQAKSCHRFHYEVP